MFVFELPEVGEGVVEGELIRWLVSEGQPVQADQPICEIMTDKATIEISSPKNGIVAKLHGKAGDVLEVHTPLIEIDLDGSQATAQPPKPAPKPEPAPKAVLPKPAPKAAPPASPKPAAPAPVSSATGKVLASPAVRAYGHQKGVDLATIHGSGRGGRITRDDIDRSLNQSPVITHPEAIKAPPTIYSKAPTSSQDEVIPIIGLRRKIAEKMLQSVQTAPHFTYVDEVDATALVALRKELKSVAAERGVKLTYIPFVMKALVIAFGDFPQINAVMNEDTFALTVRGEVNIGIATDTAAGLYVPVIKNVEQKSILQLAHEITDLTTRTREGKVQLSELQGGTFTITSVGNIGGRFATPIINHPEVAILGLNQIHDRPMVYNGEIVARKMMYLSPSFDHRIIDGAVAARFVARLKEILEQPSRLLLDLG